jgi:hypothetical protein
MIDLIFIISLISQLSMFAPNCSICQNGIYAATVHLVRRTRIEIVVYFFLEVLFTRAEVTIRDIAPPAIIMAVCQP